MRDKADLGSLPRLLAMAKQWLAELDSLGGPARWEDRPVGTSIADDRAADLLIRLGLVARQIDALLSRYIGGHELEALPLPPGLRAFLIQRWIPAREAIGSAYQSLSAWEVLDESNDDDVPQAGSEESLSKLTESALSYLRDKAEDAPGWFWLSVEGVGRLEEAWLPPYVDLDSWHQNRSELRPLVSRRPAREFPVHVRRRLVEIHRSYIFGNWLAVASLARAALEYVLIDRASTLGFDPFEPITHEPLKLADMIDRARTRDPSLAAEMDMVREAGNRVMHPRRHEKAVHHPGAMRGDARSAVQAIFAIVESLYPAKDERR